MKTPRTAHTHAMLYEFVVVIFLPNSTVSKLDERIVPINRDFMNKAEDYTAGHNIGPKDRNKSGYGIPIPDGRQGGVYSN
ncbi:hypothetical protein [Paenibacillus sp. MAH-36]